MTLIARPAATADHTPLEEAHQRRVHRLVLLCSAVTGVGGLGWAVFFALRGDWPIVGFETLVVLGSLASTGLARAERLRAACRLLVAMMFVVLLVFATFIDLPSAAAPRSTHQIMLAMGIVASLLMRDEAPWLRHGAPALYFLAWIVFGASNAVLSTRYALPVDVQAVGGWVNHGLSTVMVLLALRVIQTDTAERSALEAELRDAILRGELVLQYQPQVADGGQVTGAEALVRWRHPTRGTVPPGEFIPVAERCGLMGALGDWVLAEGCRRLADWGADPRTAHLTMAVNVSAAQFEQDDFVERVLGHLARAGANPARLKLELTESMLARDIDAVVAKMQALKARGIGFSLDDFGTGFSSLSYLRQLPLDQLKIDRSFVGNMLASRSDAAIARTVVDLGRSLGLQVIAEGVETDDQRRALLGIGCAAYQGFLFARPLDEPQFTAFVHTQRARRRAAGDTAGDLPATVDGPAHRLTADAAV